MLPYGKEDPDGLVPSAETTSLLTLIPIQLASECQLICHTALIADENENDEKDLGMKALNRIEVSSKVMISVEMDRTIVRYCMLYSWPGFNPISCRITFST
jgi:hypothetical protein